jgi:hypothetical protein
MKLAGARHLDLAVTVLITLIVGVLAALNVTGPAVLAGATLSTLGLITVGSLHGRLQQRSLSSAIAELSSLTNEHLRGGVLTSSTSGTGLDLTEATDIRILGVTLARTIRTNFETLHQRLHAGATIQIVLIEPAAEVIAEAARRNSIPDAPEIFEHRLQPTFDMLRQLEAAGGNGSLEIRLLNFVPAFGLIAVNADGPNGRLYVDVYSHRPGVTEPTIPLSAARDQPWYHHFVEEFDRVWESGRPVWINNPHQEAPRSSIGRVSA